MDMEKTILVSGASGIVGYGILKSLRQSKEKYRLIGTTIYEDSAAQGFCDVFEKAPITSDKSYIPWLIEIIKKYDIDMIIPSIEIDMFAWNEHRSVLEATGCFVMLNNSSLLNLCADKWLFFLELEKYNSKYKIPTSLDPNQKDLKFPLILKPRRGFASQGIVVVNDKKEYERYRSEIGKKLMVQQLIGNVDEEYTISAFFDKESKLCCYMPLKRKLSKEGFTETAQTVEIDGIKEAILELSEIFKPMGPTNFQFRKDEGRLKLLEINPRISSATSIRTAFGYNESVMAVEYFLDSRKITQPIIKKGSAVRYTEDMIYYDSSNI